MEKAKIEVEATVKAGIEKVWVHYTEPHYIVKWNNASADWHCPQAENDLRVGGIYKARMESRDGKTGFDFEAVYDKIIPHNTLVYTLTDGREVVNSFEDLAGETKVSTGFDPDKEFPHGHQKEGWQAILDNFKKHVENT